MSRFAQACFLLSKWNNMPETSTKTCLSCTKTLHGRIDKKFCNDYCRNNYNNGLKSGSNTTVRNINNALLKNRRILETILGGEEMAKTTKERLLQQGFLFKYSTHTYTNKKGNVYHFCYECGYLPLEGDWLLVVKRTGEV
ncbi:MAG: hypothetical protein JWP69_2089 [Flaviaesturariibacter sp.]|nr:hypothetical protein [Flaviaesturariibacter sp.]